MTSVIADTERHLFLVGTMSLNSFNEVHLIQYSEEKNDVWCVGLYPHKHEIWSISPCPSEKDLFFTVYNTGKEYKTSLWKMPPLEETEKENSSAKLECLLTIEGHSDPLHNVLWNTKLGSLDRILTVDNSSVKEWNIDSISKKSESISTYSILGNRVTCAKWDPHHPNLVAVASRSKIQQIDLRTKKY